MQELQNADPRLLWNYQFMTKAPLLVSKWWCWYCSSGLLFTPWLSCINHCHISLSLSSTHVHTHTHTHTHTHKDFQDILSCKRKSVSSRGSDLPSTLTYATTNSFATKELSCWMAPSYMDMEAFQKSPHANFKKYTQKDWELFYLLLS